GVAPRRFVSGDEAALLIHQLTGAGHVQIDRPTTLEEPFRQVETLLLESQRTNRGLELQPGAASVGIGANRLRRDIDPHQVPRGLDGFIICPCRLNSATNAAKEVE